MHDQRDDVGGRWSDRHGRHMLPMVVASIESCGEGSSSRNPAQPLQLTACFV